MPLTAKDRLTALQSGEVDVLARKTTGSSSARHVAVAWFQRNYFDGQGFIVRKALKLNSALELGDAAVCVQQGTDDLVVPRQLFPRQQDEAQDRYLCNRDQGSEAY